MSALPRRTIRRKHRRRRLLARPLLGLTERMLRQLAPSRPSPARNESRSSGLMGCRGGGHSLRNENGGDAQSASPPLSFAALAHSPAPICALALALSLTHGRTWCLASPAGATRLNSHVTEISNACFIDAIGSHLART